MTIELCFNSVTLQLIDGYLSKMCFNCVTLQSVTSNFLGPGCSSLGVGAFSENGLFRPSGKALVRNEYSWNRELSLLKETSIRGLSLSTPKLNSVSENAVCCLWDGELIIVNGDQDMFVVSVLLQKKIYRNLDSVSQVYKKDLIVAQGVISAPAIHKEKKKINIVLTLFEVSPNLTCDGAASMEVLSSRASCYKEVGEYKKAVVDCIKLTGRVEEKRRWSEGIHHAVEAKEGVKIELAEGAKAQFSRDYSDNLALVRAYEAWKEAERDIAGYEYFFEKIDVETPKFELIKSTDGYKICKYSPSVITEVTYDSTHFKGKKDGDFMILVNYIAAVGNPQNSTPEKITMTTPVITQTLLEKIPMTAPMVTKEVEDKEKKMMTMQFILPEKYRKAD
ncbi:Serine carboxypeptidase-like 46 [Camellia lanceoleosa]|uniref:Serine carboxypeptidase-like 46 n=1 Tax=Camellia lanceoleosa TaxID=1840588 RepID=A0ACC0IJT1_9ERIC|nr:Serine carboxypeptidase-like 46 [Camellia lanceoleosa]